MLSDKEIDDLLDKADRYSEQGYHETAKQLIDRAQASLNERAANGETIFNVEKITAGIIRADQIVAYCIYPSKLKESP